MIASTTSSDLVWAMFGLLITAVVGISVFISKTRERLARLEEWVRLHNNVK